MISIDEFKVHSRIVDDPANAGPVQAGIDMDIERKILAAAVQAEMMTGRTFSARPRTIRFAAWAALLDIPGPPLQSVTAVSYLDAGLVERTLPASDYWTVRSDAVAQLGFRRPGDLPELADRGDAVRVSYIAGYPAGEVPAPVLIWTMMRAAAMFETRESDNDRPAARSDFVDMLLDPYKVWAA